MRTPLKIGIDLGGTKVGILALEQGQRRLPTPRGDYRQTLALIASLVEACEQ